MSVLCTTLLLFPHWNARQADDCANPFRSLDVLKVKPCSVLIECNQSSLRPAASELYSGAVYFPIGSQSTALGHKLAETCEAMLRHVLRLGHAGTAKPTGQHQKKNDWSLNGSILGSRGGCTHNRYRFDSYCFHSETNGFPFGSLFYGKDRTVSPMSRRATHHALWPCTGNSPSSFWGVFLFCLSFFSFYLFLPKLVPIYD